jgi:RND family efflux transporter MFP subunit
MRIAILLLFALPAFAADLVATEPAIAGPWEKTVTLPAEALPYHRVHLGTSATGWVGEVSADIGSRVRKGDLLAEIRSPELVAARKARAEETRAAKQKTSQAAAMFRSAEALAEAAKSESSRISSLAKSGTVTTKARDESAARLAAAVARVGEAEAMIAGAEAEALAAAARETEATAALEYTRIAAPFDGIVVERRAEPGDFLGPGSVRENLFTLEQIDPLRIRIEIPEHAAALAGAGDPVTIRIAGREITAKLDRAAGSLDPVTKTMAAEIDLNGTGLIPGSFGSATLTTEKLDNVVLVPLAALRTNPDGTLHVLVAEGDTRRDVPVELLTTEGTTAVLSRGPANGDRVVVP